MEGIVPATISLLSFFTDLVGYLASDTLSLVSGNKVFYSGYLGGIVTMAVFFLFVNLKKNNTFGFLKVFFKEYYLLFSAVAITSLFLIAVSGDSALTFNKEESYSLRKELAAVQNEMTARLDQTAQECEVKLAENNVKNEEEKNTALTEAKQLKEVVYYLNLVDQKKSEICHNLVTSSAAFPNTAENTGSTITPTVAAVRVATGEYSR